GLHHAGFESQVLGRTKQFGIGEQLSRLRVQVAQLRSISRQIVESSKDQEADQTCVGATGRERRGTRRSRRNPPYVGWHGVILAHLVRPLRLETLEGTRIYPIIRFPVNLFN